MHARNEATPQTIADANDHHRPPVIVAFLQNQWFKNPERVKVMFARNPERREALVKTFLFYQCATGRQLKLAFGETLCHRIVWEEASANIGGYSASAFPADPEHMRRVVEKHKPDVVMAFGRIASAGCAKLDLSKFQYIEGPHPTARGEDTLQRLVSMADQLRTWLHWFEKRGAA